MNIVCLCFLLCCTPEWFRHLSNNSTLLTLHYRRCWTASDLPASPTVHLCRASCCLQASSAGQEKACLLSCPWGFYHRGKRPHWKPLWYSNSPRIGLLLLRLVEQFLDSWESDLHCQLLCFFLFVTFDSCCEKTCCILLHSRALNLFTAYVSSAFCVVNCQRYDWMGKKQFTVGGVGCREDENVFSMIRLSQVLVYFNQITTSCHKDMTWPFCKSCFVTIK